ncbi:MAG: tetratricopeptide repeat protein [Muribaculaceae bacterium]|nr:tetratricopeptide repeat protein [Muribaculaceae bacterium]
MLRTEKFNEAFELHNNGKLTDARDLYLEILKTEPANAQVWDLLGVLYYQANEYLEAERCIKKAIDISPRFYYLENLARLYLDMGDFELAIAIYEDLVKHNPTYDNWFNLAMAYKGSKNWIKSKEAYYKSLEINPKGYESYFNLAYLALNENHPQEAVECYKKALEINPEDWESMYFLSLAQMQTKDYKNGLANFESRLCRQSAIVTQEKTYPNLMKTRPVWNGEDLSGKTLFTYYEAGYGDMLMLYRYMPILTSMCKKVIIKPQKELAPLFRENSYGAEVLEIFDFESELDFDYHIPFLSVPYVLGLEGEDVFVNKSGYLKANPAKIKYYGDRYFDNDKFKIGIKWQGNTHYDLERVLKVEDFFRLFELEGTQFYSCQTFEGSEEFEKIKDKYDVIDLGSTFSNFSDTAGALQNMDLIISNDTSLVHLAGAMGKPCMVLLPHVYNWRWHTDLTKCDWYDSVKIFVQPENGDWKSVFDEVEGELVKLLH